MRLLIYLCALLLVACGGPADKPTASGGEVHNLDATAFSEKLKEDVVLLDVRTPEEFADTKIEGATNLNFQDPSFEKWLDSLDHTKRYAVYCAGGGRSSRAAALMKEKGFKEINNLSGGIKSWKESGRPVVPQ